jgi:serine protease Do
MIALLAAALALSASNADGEGRYQQLKPSLFTIEVHSGNQEAKSVLGSGYLVSSDGHVVTNYHVVGSYIEEPDRFSIRVRNGAGERPARLLGFDLVNDLALLEVSGLAGRPLPLAEGPPPPGAPIVAFGNPEGLGLSLIDGVFNGFAEKGVVDRMLLSMPLNSGMSGGPILNRSSQVIGTNVSVMRESNSLSFGVPVTKLRAMLARPPIETTKKALLDETHRQLRDLERATAARLIAGFDRSQDETKVAIGGARSRRPPTLFECWDGSRVNAKEGITDGWLQCNLQFTPSIENLGAVASLQMILHHRSSQKSAYGFYAALEQQATGWSRVHAVNPGDDVRTPPQCVAGRFVVSGSVWKANTCVTGYAKHAGFADYELTAVSVSEARSAVLVYLQMGGFRQASFEALARKVLEGIQPGMDR